MTDRPNRLTDDVIGPFLRSRAADADVTLLDDIVRGARQMPQQRSRLSWSVQPQRLLVIAVAAILLALAAGIAIGRFTRPEPRFDARMPVVDEVVADVNARDAGAIRLDFAPESTVVLLQIESTGQRVAPLSEWSIDLENFAEAWMTSAETWGLEAFPLECNAASASEIVCDVVARWHTLRVEGIERWTFAFNEAGLVRLETVRTDDEPSNPELPLRYRDLELWEAWLAVSRPEVAGRVLAGDPLIWNFYFPYAADGHDLQQLVDAYLEETR